MTSNKVLLVKKNIDERVQSPIDKIALTEISNEPDAKFSKDLFWAAKFGDATVIENFFSDYSGKDVPSNKLDEHQMSPLHYAARGNRVDVVKMLISHGADINLRGYSDNTPMFMAAKHNSLASFEVLHEAGAEPKLPDDQGNTLLHEVCKLGHLQICKFITEKKLLDVNVVDDDLDTPLHLATLRGRYEICQHLLKCKANMLAATVDGTTPVHCAASKGYNNILELFLNEAATNNLNPKDLMTYKDNENQLPLHRAAQGGHAEAIAKCLVHGTNINAVQKTGLTALHITSANGHLDATSLLIEKGASPNLHNHLYQTPFFLASSYGHLSIMQILLDLGVDVNAIDQTKKTPLLCAAAKGHIDIYDYLISHNADIDKVDEENLTCLHVAVIYGHFQLIKHIMQTPAKKFLNSPDTYEKTPLHYAVEGEDSQIVEYLVQQGAKIDVHDDDDNTPLHVACKNGRFVVAQFLCSKSWSLINSLGEKARTPLHLAVIHDSIGTAAMLLKYGADVEKRDGSCTTPLELIASKDYAMIGKLLIKNGAHINRINARLETPLHVAARNGSIDVTKLLLENGCDITLRNSSEKTCLDIAIENEYEKIAMAIVRHRRSGEILNKVDGNGFTVMQALIEKLPNVASEVLNISIARSTNDDMDKMAVYDYSLLDPGPKVEARLIAEQKSNTKCNALLTMLAYKRTGMLLHELPLALIDAKWQSFGALFYFGNLFLYLLFLGALTYFTVALRPPGNIVKSTATISNSSSLNLTTTSSTSKIQENPGPFIAEVVILIFTCVNILLQIFQMLRKRLQYFFSISNFIQMALYVSAIAFVVPPGQEPLPGQWAVGSITILLAWFNLLDYLQNLPTIGIYVAMFRSVSLTFFKVGALLVFLIVAFGLSFYIILGHEKAFSSGLYSILKTFDMMVGELDYNDMFFTPIYEKRTRYPFDILAIIIFLTCTTFLPIVAINLTVGLAVGDIDKIERNAVLSRIKVQVEFLDQIERELPSIIRERLYYSQEEKKELGFQMKLKTYFKQAQDVVEVEDEDNNTQNEIEEVKDQLKHQDEKLNRLISCVDELGKLIYSMHNKSEQQPSSF